MLDLFERVRRGELTSAQAADQVLEARYDTPWFALAASFLFDVLFKH